MCELMKRGGKLQEIGVDVMLDPLEARNSSDLLTFETLLRPLERLSGLKSATVKGLVTEAYGAALKSLLEDGGTRKYRKRKAETDEGGVVLRPKRRRGNE